jgi:hypothetical protein
MVSASLDSHFISSSCTTQGGLHSYVLLNLFVFVYFLLAYWSDPYYLTSPTMSMTHLNQLLFVSFLIRTKETFLPTLSHFFLCLNGPFYLSLFSSLQIHKLKPKVTGAYLCATLDSLWLFITCLLCWVKNPLKLQCVLVPAETSMCILGFHM